MRLRSWLFAAAGLLAGRPGVWSDLPEAIRAYLVHAGAADADSFDRWRENVNRDTERREQAGEDEHVTYFVLQSAAFTARPRIEPAVSAREFAEKGSVPAAVRARIDDFLRALGRTAQDERMRYWNAHLAAGRRTAAGLEAAYAEAMRFLYRKEFGPGGAALYETRGHSLDTQVEANYAVFTGLAVLRRLDPAAHLERVLILGPGLDLAPRTGFRDDLPLQSYQPYLTADSLLRCGLARPDRLVIHCVDLHPAVIRFLEEFSRRARPELQLPATSGDADYEEFFREAGTRIGQASATPWGRRVRVRKELAARVAAIRLNAVTERFDRAPQYDLVVATNILVYFHAAELAVALANVQAMLRPGGWLLHNELRPEAEEAARRAGLPPVQGRTLQVAAGQKRPLMDAFVLHRKQ